MKTKNTHNIHNIHNIHFMTTLLMSICLLGACAWEEQKIEYELNYDNAKEAAMSAWEMQIGWISDSCLEHLDKVAVKETTDIHQYCPTKNAVGCMFISPEGMPTNEIFLDIIRLNDKILKTAVHEYIHHIESCEYKPEYWKNNPEIEYSDLDMMHYNKTIWGLQKDSVENIGNEIVIKLNIK